MNRAPADHDVLLAEIERYLAAVELFRAEGYEPSWCPEHSDACCPRPKSEQVAKRSGLSVP